MPKEKEKYTSNNSFMGMQPQQPKVVFFGRGKIEANAPAEVKSDETEIEINTSNKDKALKKDIKRVSAPLDTKNCLDCQGSGFWYPEGTEKGVAKCKHERLREGK